MKLPPDRRKRPAAGRIAEAGVEAAWESEVEKRRQDTDQGKARLVAWDGVKAGIERKLEKH